MKQIPLSQGKVSLVDDADYDFLMQWKWYAAKSPVKNRADYYAIRKECSAGKQIQYKMHRVIMQETNSKIFIDHKDWNGLNNQRVNLRSSTRGQNAANGFRSDGQVLYRGVCRYRRGYYAQITKNGKRKVLGYFDSAELAAVRYDQEAILLHGEFANLNFPGGRP